MRNLIWAGNDLEARGLLCELKVLWMTYAETSILTTSPKRRTSCFEYISLSTPWLYRRRTVKREFWRHRIRRTPNFMSRKVVGGFLAAGMILFLVGVKVIVARYSCSAASSFVRDLGLVICFGVKPTMVFAFSDQSRVLEKSMDLA